MSTIYSPLREIIPCKQSLGTGTLISDKALGFRTHVHDCIIHVRAFCNSMPRPAHQLYSTPTD